MIEISEGECLDTLREVLEDKAPFRHINYVKGLVLEDTLKVTDIELLEKYAPKLFDCYPSPKDLHSVMLEWATLLHNHRNVQLEKTLIHSMQGKAVEPRYTNKSLDEKTDILKARAKDIQDIINTNFSINEDIKELLKALVKIQKNPSNYINTKPKYHIRKRPIRDYLKSLNLKGKGEEITSFIEEIK